MKKISTVGATLADEEFSRSEVDDRAGSGGSMELVLRVG